MARRSAARRQTAPQRLNSRPYRVRRPPTESPAESARSTVPIHVLRINAILSARLERGVAKNRVRKRYQSEGKARLEPAELS